MSDLHSLGASAPSSSQLEAVSPEFLVAGLLQARENTQLALAAIREGLQTGMTEDDARRLALDVFAGLGVKKHWHRPYIRFGMGTALTFHDPLQPDYRLQAGDPYYVDLGPVWPDADRGLEYEGDFGDTFVWGSHPEAEKCAATARSIFAEAQERWREARLTGEGLYEFMKERAGQEGYVLVKNVDGHRLSDFPHHKYSKERLAGVRIVPSESLWVLEIQLNDRQGRFGAFFEDLL